MHHVAYFLVHNMLAKFQLFCIITCRDILYFVFWLPYCHTLWHHQYLICIIQKLWISLEWYEIWQKWKHHSSSLLKAFQIHLFFNTSIFHFIGTLNNSVLLQMLMLSSFVSHLSHDKPCHYMLIVIRYPNGPVHYVVVLLPSLVWDRGSLGRGVGGGHIIVILHTWMSSEPTSGCSCWKGG